MNTKQEHKAISLSIPEALYEALKEQAVREDRSKSAVLRRIVAAYYRGTAELSGNTAQAEPDDAQDALANMGLR